MNSIGDKLRKLREEKNISSKEFSENIKINQSTYSKLENDKKSISVNELKKICEYYNVSADSILKINNEINDNILYMKKDKKISDDDIKEVEMILSMMDEAIDLHYMKERYKW